MIALQRPCIWPSRLGGCSCTICLFQCQRTRNVVMAKMNLGALMGALPRTNYRLRYLAQWRMRLIRQPKFSSLQLRSGAKWKGGSSGRECLVDPAFQSESELKRRYLLSVHYCLGRSHGRRGILARQWGKTSYIAYYWCLMACLYVATSCLLGSAGS